MIIPTAMPSLVNITPSTLALGDFDVEHFHEKSFPRIAAWIEPLRLYSPKNKKILKIVEVMHTFAIYQAMNICFNRSMEQSLAEWRCHSLAG